MKRPYLSRFTRTMIRKGTLYGAVWMVHFRIKQYENAVAKVVKILKPKKVKKEYYFRDNKFTPDDPIPWIDDGSTIHF